MQISRDCAIELCKTLTASALWGGSALIKAASPVATVETLLGATALIASLGHERAQEVENILNRMAGRVTRESEVWIAARGPGAKGKREEALPAVQRVISTIEPSAQELVKFGLDRGRIVNFYLERAATLDGGTIFSDAPGNEVARELLGDVIRYTFDIVRTSPEVVSHALEALLGRSERLEEKIDNLPEKVTQRIVAMLPPELLRSAKQGGLGHETIFALARRLKPKEMLDFDQAVRELENAVGIALDAITRGERGSNFGDFVDAVLARVAGETKAGAFERAVLEVDAALAELSRRDMEHRENLLRWRAALIETAIEQEILRRDAFAVARRIESLVSLQATSRPAALSPDFRERYDYYYEQGKNRGVNLSFEVAIELARLTLRDSQTPKERGDANNLLGIALGTLGERKGNEALLQDAVAAYREALKEWTRDRVPLQWAMTQNNLGIALGTLGERKGNEALLQDAVTAYREALKEWTRDKVPLQWAMTQNNLGIALRILGDRKGNEALLQDAVAACREALKEWTRDKVPLQWAGTQNNLGNALGTLGERKGDEALLQDAVAAFREALKERTRERTPYYWENATRNLARAEALLARRRGAEKQ